MLPGWPNEMKFDNPPLSQGRRFGQDLREPLGGFLLLAPFGQAHFTSDPGLAGRWVLDKLVVPRQEFGYRPCKDRTKWCIGSLDRRPEGGGFSRTTGKPHCECNWKLADLKTTHCDFIRFRCL
jgi:hypothetical protein